MWALTERGCCWEGEGCRVLPDALAFCDLWTSCLVLCALVYLAQPCLQTAPYGRLCRPHLRPLVTQVCSCLQAVWSQ